MSDANQSSSDQITPPKSLTERLKTEAANGHYAEEDETTASFMAERFAPELAQADADAPEAAYPSGRMAAPVVERGLFANRLLLTALIVIACAPSVLLGMLLWQGGIELPGLGNSPFAGETAAPPQVVQAATAPMSVAETILPKRDIELPTAELSLPATISAEAGKPIPFAIALSRAESLPPRSVIAIRGLPEGTRFSAGRPYGGTEWTLRPDELANLRLTLPRAATGQRSLAVELLAADGATIASANTRLEVALDPRAALILRPEDSDRIAELLDLGHKMIEVGYFAGARSYYQRAAEAGSAEGALEVGATYDPSFIKEVGAHGIKPDLAKARAWYERAKLLGHQDAEARLAALRHIPEPAVPAESKAEPIKAAAAEDVSANEPIPTAEVEEQGSRATDPQEEAEEQEWVEISGAVNVRAGPTSESETLKVAQRGSRYQAIGRQGNWVQVSDPKTAEVGWIYSRFLAQTEPPQQ